MFGCSPSSGRRRRAVAVATLVSMLAAAGAAGQVIVDVRQGTDLAVAVSPDGQTLVIDLLGGLWTLPSSGGAATPLVAIEEGAKHPQWSPDGRLIVYQRFVDSHWDIWALDIASGMRWPVTTDPGNEVEPVFVATSDTIAFAADREGRFDIWTASVRGGDWQLLVGGRGDARYPAASEHGDIAYIEHAGDTWSLRLRLQGATHDILTTPHPLTSPSWRPGGGVVVFHETDHAAMSRLRMLILAEDRVLRSLTDAEDVFATRLAWIAPNEFLYAADGQIWRRELASRSRRPVHLFAALSIDAMPTEPLTLRTATDTQLEAHGIASVSHSIDGERTAFAALGDIWVIDGGQLRALTQDAYWDADPVIAADGRFVVFSSDRSGTRQIFRSTISEGSPEQLTFDVEHAFKPSLDLSGTRLAYLTSTALDPSAAASLNVRYLDDGTQVRGQVVVTDADRPEWLPTTGLAVVARRGGAREQLTFDAALRLVERDAAPDAEPPATPPVRPQWARARPDVTQRYAIQAGRLFDGTGSSYRRHVDIHVEGEQIVAVVGRNVLPLPERVIDATELTVIPGLIDAHMHDAALAGEWLGRELLAHGVTTVRMLAHDVPAAIARAESWAAGQPPGPRVLVEPREPPPAIAALPDGYPVAILATRGFLDDPNREARVWGHLPGAADRRLSPLFHPYQDVFGTVMASGRAEVTSLALLAPTRVAEALDERSSTPVGLAAAYRMPLTAPPAPETQALRARQQTLLRLIRGGGRVAIGSDSPRVPPGLGTQLELELLHAAGVAPDQVLRIATAGGAIALGVDRELGTIEDGKIADLLVLAGDPLANLASLRRIEAIVVAGQWLDRRQLLDSTPQSLRAENLRGVQIQ